MGLQEKHEVRGEIVCFGKGESGSNGLNLMVVAIVNRSG